ncbi:hypothetical protein D3C80_1958190 [compost metagenome]
MMSPRPSDSTVLAIASVSVASTMPAMSRRPVVVLASLRVAVATVLMIHPLA